MRILAIGDVHGHILALRALIATVSPRKSDLLLFIGDYVDKGPDVKAVLDYLISLSQEYDTIFLRGNHDQMMIDAHRDPEKLPIWASLSGGNSLSSYGDGTLPMLLTKIPPEHWDFLEKSCMDYYETPSFIFVHGGIRSHAIPAEEEVSHMQWLTLSSAEKHHSGRTVVCGHSAQTSGKIADFGHTICIDTAIASDGWLSCLDMDSFEFWQASADGQVRSGFLRLE